MSIFVNERYSGSKHVTDDTRAQINDAIIGGNFVFDTGSVLAITVAPAAGTVTIADGSFSFAGRTGGIKLTESASYTPPAADTLYTKNVVSIRYSRDTDSNYETFSLIVTSSDAQESESAAAALDVVLASSEISDSTVTADFPLWSFVANASSNTTPVKLFDTVSSLSRLLDKANDLLKAINTEVTNRKNAVSSEASARQTADSAMQMKITAINSSISSINSNLSSINAKISELGKKNIILSSVSSGSLSTYTSDRPITDFSMLMVKYENVDYGYFEYYCIPAIQMSSGEGYYHVIRDYKASGSGLSFKLTTYLPRVIITTYNENFTVQCVPNDGGYFVELIGIY